MKINNTTGTIILTIITRIDLIVNLLNNLIQVKKSEDYTPMETNFLITPTHGIAYWIMQIFITVVIFIVVYKIFNKLNKQSLSIGIIFAYMNESPIPNKQLAKYLKISDAKQLREMGVINLDQEKDLIKEINEFKKSE